MNLMRYKKFLLIPAIFILLVLLYANFINSLSESAEFVRGSSTFSKSGTGEAIGVGQAVSIKVTRATKPYLFGIVNLPAYAQGMGSLTGLHAIFFWSLYTFTILLTAGFVIIERRNVNMVKAQNTWKVSDGNIWLRLGKAVGIGALFALVAFLISGDNSSLAFGLLVAYLEFRHSSR
jgi:hypothetical protein